MTYSPLVAITMGDAAGIGAEIIMKSLGHAEVSARCRPLVIGEAERLRAAGRIMGSSLAVRVVPLRAYRGPETQPRTKPCPKVAWSRVLHHPTKP